MFSGETSFALMNWTRWYCSRLVSSSFHSRSFEFRLPRSSLVSSAFLAEIILGPNSLYYLFRNYRQLELVESEAYFLDARLAFLRGFNRNSSSKKLWESFSSENTDMLDSPDTIFIIWSEVSFCSKLDGIKVWTSELAERDWQMKASLFV